MDRALDLPYILQKNVYPRWASATPEQQSELQPALRSYIIATYVANFDDYSGDRFEVSPELRKAANGDQIVHTRFVPPSGDVRVIDYVMRQTDGSWKAGDVLLDGTISRVAVLRSEFRHIFAEGGFEALLTNLRKKVADLLGGTITGRIGKGLHSVDQVRGDIPYRYEISIRCRRVGYEGGSEMDQRTGVSQLLGRLLINPIFVISGYAKLAQLPYVSMCFLLSLSLGAARYTVGLFTRPAAVVLGVWCVATAVVATAIGCTSR